MVAIYFFIAQEEFIKLVRVVLEPKKVDYTLLIPIFMFLKKFGWDGQV
jgi:hypothetical protein